MLTLFLVVLALVLSEGSAQALGATCTVLCDDLNAECTSSQVCQCKSGFIETSGSCKQSCATGNCSDANAVCDSNKICVCKAGYKDTRRGCRGTTELSGTCDVDSDCISLHSYCNGNKKCACRPKFKPLAGGCEPKLADLKCPKSIWFNAPMKDRNNNVQQCIIRRPAASSQTRQLSQTQSSCPKRYNNCPYGSYCHPFETSNATSDYSVKDGFCCPAQIMCPAGDHRKTTTLDSCADCPTKTHFCFCDQLTNVAACCPRPCSLDKTCSDSGAGGGTVVTNTCRNDKQCPRGATCSQVSGQSGKQCVCDDGLNYINGTCTTSLCANGDPEITNNAIKTCSATISCSANYSCDLSRGVCCPTSSS